MMLSRWLLYSLTPRSFPSGISSGKPQIAFGENAHELQSPQYSFDGRLRRKNGVTPASIRLCAPAVHKTPPPIPSIAGQTFTGTATAKGKQFALTVTFGTETAKGALTASVLFEGDTVGSKGSVTATRAVTFQGKFGKVHFVLHGKLDAALDTITGRYTDTGKKGSISGPFSLTKLG